MLLQPPQLAIKCERVFSYSQFNLLSSWVSTARINYMQKEQTEAKLFSGCYQKKKQCIAIDVSFQQRTFYKALLITLLLLLLVPINLEKAQERTTLREHGRGLQPELNRELSDFIFAQHFLAHHMPPFKLLYILLNQYHKFQQPQSQARTRNNNHQIMIWLQQLLGPAECSCEASPPLPSS